MLIPFKLYTYRAPMHMQLDNSLCAEASGQVGADTVDEVWRQMFNYVEDCVQEPVKWALWVQLKGAMRRRRT